jgi:DNA-binding protein YbaB
MTGYEELADAARRSMRAYQEETARLAARQIEGRSEDGEVTARVTADGTLVSLRLRPDALRHYDSAGLADLIGQTIRGAQRSAREEFERDAAAATPAAVTEAADVVRAALRRGPAAR